MIEGALRAWSARFAPSGRVGVAVSGGRDSMVLLHASVRVFGRPVVVHVDHGVRPESEEDARFVHAWSRRQGLRVWSRRLQQVLPREAALRQARHRTFQAAVEEEGLDWLLLAHHRGDQAETVLFRLLRDGRTGGMPEIRPPLARPLLRCPAEAVASYAKRHGVRFREDVSNREPRFLRNRLRKELLPLLEQAYRPGVTERLARLGDPLGHIEVSTRPVEPQDFQRSGPLRALFDRDLLPSPRIRPLNWDDRGPDPGGNGEGSLLPHRERTHPSVWAVADPQGILWVPGFEPSKVAAVGPNTGWVWDFCWKWS